MRSATFQISVTADEQQDFVDLTDELQRAVKDSGVIGGCCVAFCGHTTCVLIVNEWEDGTLEDLRKRLGNLVPADFYYAHDDTARRTQNLEEGEERVNGRAHVAAMLLGGTSHAIPIAGARAQLGTWQRLFLLELDEPKQRVILFHVFGE